jgi:signal transduction histidine kinase
MRNTRYDAAYLVILMYNVRQIDNKRNRVVRTDQVLQMKDISSQNRNSRLRQILIDYFDEGELRTLCADLQVDYDTLPGEGKDNQARELVSYLDRRSRLAELVKVGKEHRPNAPWEADTDVCQEPVPDSPPAQAPTSSVRVNNQPSPYRGLQVFREEHTEFFFGREIFTERLIGEVQQRSQRSAFKPLVAVIGASGSGKSSVIFAGLVPRLRQTGAWECVDFRPGSRPFAALASALLPLFDLQKNEEDPVGETLNLAEQLRQGEVKLSDIVNKIIQQEKEVDHLLLIVDQFEEIYTLCKDGELRERFLDMLLQTIDVQQHQRRMVLVLTLRADFLGQALTYRALTDALQGSIEMLGPMTSPEMMQAIVEPAKKLNVSFETGLVEHILQDVGSDQGRLPLLEFTLELLWQSGQLTHAAYNALGGVERALAQQANAVYEQLNEPDRQRVEHLVVQLVQPGEGTEDTRRRATHAEIGEANWTLVTRLASKRLVITARNDTGEETVEIVHEALIREWGLLREWIHNHRAFRMWQERLRFMLRQWQTSSQDEEALLRGFLLSEAQEWLSKQEYSLSQSEREFIQQSIALREHNEQVNAERIRELQIEKQRLEVLHEITLAITKSLDLNEIIRRVLEMSSIHLNVARGSIMLREQSASELVCRAVLQDRGVVRSDSKPSSFSCGTGLAEWVIVQQEPARIEDVRRDPRWIIEEGRADDVRSVAAVPLMTRDATLGVLILTSPIIGHFTEAHIRLLATIANEVGIAINNATLYSYITEMATRLADLLEHQREETSKSQAILRSMTEGVIVLDEEQRIVLFNPVAERVLEIAAAEVLEQPVVLLATQGRTDPQRKRIGIIYNGLHTGLEKSHEQQSIYSVFLELVDPPQTIAVNIAPVLGPDDRRYGDVIMLRDITREVESDRFKTVFFNNMSVELRTPMTAIKGFTQLLVMEQLGALNGTQHELLKTILMNADRMINIINDVLDITKIIENGSIDLDLRSLHLADLLNEVITDLQPLIRDHKHNLAMHIPPDLLVRADSSRLHQVLYNIVSNAVKYTPRGGELKIDAHEVVPNDLPEWVRDNIILSQYYIQVNIRDTGVGIASEDLERVFNRFYRTENPLKAEAGGVGLGLSLAKPLVELQGGHIWVESVLNEGSTFSFILPAS